MFLPWEAELIASDAIKDRVENPQIALDIDSFAERFIQSAITIEMPATAEMREPRYLGKLRGALGEALKKLACTRCLQTKTCACAPPSAFHLLYRFEAAKTPGLAIPRPFAAALTVSGRTAALRISLFGLAVEWSEEIAAGLMLALQDGLGLQPNNRHIESPAIEPPPWSPFGMIMAFETPLNLRLNRHDRAAASGPQTKLLMSIITRVTGIARWHDTKITGDFAALKDQAARTQAWLLDEPQDHWRRYSNRQQRWIPMSGAKPVLLLQGDLAPFLPYLALGTALHTGSHTALGLGRYSLHPATNDNA